MSTGKRVSDWFWPVMPVLGVMVMFLVGVMYDDLWMKIGVFHIEPYFADMVAILAASDARLAGVDPYLPRNGFDYFGRPHVYGPLWLELGRLGVSRANFIGLGVSLGMASLIAAVAWLKPRGLPGTLITFALIGSPAMLLGYERANNDLVVLLLLIAAAVALRSVAWPRMSLAATLILLAAVLKLYPLAALPMLAVRSPRWRALVCGVTAGCIFGVIWWVQRDDYALAIKLMPTEVSVHGYGAKIIYLLWSHPAMRHVCLMTGFGMGVLFWAVLAWRERGAVIPTGSTAAGFVAGGLTWSFCFFANTNYGYRALLLLLPAAAWLAATQAGERRVRLNAWWALGGLAVMLWLTVSHAWFDQIETLMQLQLAAWTLGFENGMTWGISLYLIYSCAREGCFSWRNSSWKPSRRGGRRGLCGCRPG